MAFQLMSPAFTNGSFIPERFTCKGQDLSPALKWSGVPGNTQSFVLIVDDPDAPKGTWDHWVLYNLPAQASELPEAVTTLPVGTKVGVNSWQNAAYGGPCPPSGVHRYFFRLYALDKMLPETERLSKGQVLQAIDGHVLATAELVGLFSSEVSTSGEKVKELAGVR